MKKDIIKKILVFIKNQPIYVLVNWSCCILSIILNMIGIFTNNSTLKLIAWIFIAIQLSCILIQLKVYKFGRDIMKHEHVFNNYDFSNTERYKIEYRNRLSLLQRMKSKFSK